MLIPITLASSSNPKLPSGLVKISHDEIVLIELQGSLEVELNDPRERDGKFVGKLKIDDTNKPSLLIGHHFLEGKIAPLPKPYAIMVRNGPHPPREPDFHSSSTSNPNNQNRKSHSTTRSGPGSNDNDEGDDDAMAVDEDSAAQGPESREGDIKQGSSAGWTIMGIVKKKIIFSKRPMPVIGNKGF
ncbi:hypothetical protein BDN70DRAFT_884130 [Pholiota conissans]|uniref:Chromosome transmission fidelity protein 8 n=1 Tax=Pholiota conissans TaxID=109636 RepID=A0A9P6CPV3_9AGAR|nr:hypothetical protein BDN70DRAFT_884130 [Pholiota conissans]